MHKTNKIKQMDKKHMKKANKQNQKSKQSLII